MTFQTGSLLLTGALAIIVILKKIWAYIKKIFATNPAGEETASANKTS